MSQEATPPVEPGAQPAGAGPSAAMVTVMGAALAVLALQFTPPFEGTVHRGYRDIGGVITACTGHTETAQLGRTYTPGECRRLLESDLIQHYQGLMGCLRDGLPPHVAAAVLDFAFNVGVAKACTSNVVRKINAGDVAGGCAAFMDWMLVAGRNCALAHNAPLLRRHTQAPRR